MTGRATIAIRGTITSCRRRSPSSMTALIICSSSASRMPCSPPRSTISLSSSAVIWASLDTLTPRSRVIALVTRVRNQTIGLRTRAIHSTGPATSIDRRSA